MLAQDESRALKHNYIGTEHILLGLLREEQGLAGRVLESLGIGAEEVRAQVARIVGLGDEVATGQIPFTPRAKKVLELSLREALSLGHDYIGTEHILLGVVREREGVAMRILLDLGADGRTVRETLVAMSGPSERRERLAQILTDEPLESAEPIASVELSSPSFGGESKWRGSGVVGAVVAAAGFPLGVLVGWLIWG